MRGGYLRFAHKLALKLGYVNVEKMLAEISWSQFLTWHTYDELDPFGEDREDYRTASIVQALWNIARDVKKNPNGWPVSDFVLMFGDAIRPKRKPDQSVANMETLVNSWVWGHNAVLEAQANQKQLPAAGGTTGAERN